MVGITRPTCYPPTLLTPADNQDLYKPWSPPLADTPGLPQPCSCSCTSFPACWLPLTPPAPSGISWTPCSPLTHSQGGRVFSCWPWVCNPLKALPDCLSGHPEDDALVLSETEEGNNKEGVQDGKEEEEEEEERISQPCGTASPRDQERIVGGSQVSSTSIH